MSSVQVQLGGNAVQVQVQSSGFARANAAVTLAAASAAAALASANSAAATLAAAALKANNLSDLASASTARTNLGLGSIATQAASAVAITGGTITGITDLAVADGGTGASSASAARSNLGSTAVGDAVFIAANAAAARTAIGTGTIATQDASNVAITGGSVTDITDLAVADGGTGASTAAAARANLLANHASVADKAALTALTKATLATGDLVRTRVASGAYDGGGLDYSWNSASTETVNGGTIIASNEGGAGRWTARAGVEMVDVRNFGMNPGASAATNSTAFQNAVTACYGKNLIIPFPGGTVTYDTGVVINPANANNNGILISGAAGHGNAGAAIKYTGTISSAINFTGASTLGVANGDNRPLMFKGFTLYGPDDGAAGVNGFNLFGANGQTVLEDMWVYGFGQDNIYMEQCFGAELNRVLSNTPRRNGINFKDSANNVVLRHVRSFGAGRAIGIGDCANICIAGTLESYGVVLDSCDFSYAGNNTFVRSVANGGITQIVVTGGDTATITFAAAHGMSVGTTFGVTGGTLVAISGGKAVATVPSATTVTYYCPTTNGTYNNAELTVTAPAIGLLLSRCKGAIINGFYCETSPQSTYFNLCDSLTINGGEQLDSKMSLETNVTGVKINGLYMHGVGSTIEFYGTGENKVDVSRSCTFASSATQVMPAVYQRDGQYFGTSFPVAGAWTVGTIVNNTAPSGTSPVSQWECITAGTSGTWRAIKWLTIKNTTGNRPTLTTSDIGVTYLDTTLDADGKPIWWTGTAWVDATGLVV